MQKLTFISLMILYVLVSACNEKPLIIDCNIIEEMLEKDQRHRKNLEVLSPQFFLLDSLIKDQGYPEGLDAMPSINHQEIMTLRHKAKELLKIRSKPDQRLVDSLIQLQNSIDNENTIRLIAMINTLGIDEVVSKNRECSDNVFLIFVHSPYSLKEEVREVVELGKEQLGTNQVRHITWHLNGRKHPEKS